MFSNLRSLIFRLDPELAHNLAIKTLKFNFAKNILDDEKNNPLFKTKLFKKNIENPIGIAAGFDKNAEVYNSLFNLGLASKLRFSLLLTSFAGFKTSAGSLHADTKAHSSPHYHP